MYSLKDISVIIPTYNRAEEFSNKTLKALIPFMPLLNEIIVVDQSENEETKTLIKKLKIKNLKYIFSSPPAITIARNNGVKKISKTSKIICFLDDDLSLDRNYFSEILKVFNENPNILAVGGTQQHLPLSTFEIVRNCIKKAFFLGNFGKSVSITSAYGNNYPLKIDKPLYAQWLPGFNMAYKREVFKSQKFDENLLGYTIAEDTDFSYNLYKKRPNSIIITPEAKIRHLTSFVGRYPTEKMEYINQIDHFYFNFKNLNRSLAQKAVFVWAVFGIFALRAADLLSFKKISYLKFKFFIKSLFYCLSNLNKIKKGKLRDFNLQEV